MASDKEITDWLTDHTGSIPTPQPPAKAASDSEIESWLNDKGQLPQAAPQNSVPDNPVTRNAQAIEPGIYGDTNPTGQKILQNLGTVAGGYGIGQLAGLVGKTALTGGAKTLGLIRDYLKSGQIAETALADAQKVSGTLETPSSVGMTARAGALDEQAATKAANDALYKDVPTSSIPTTRAAQTANDVLKAQNELPQSFQSNKLIKMAEDIRDLNNGSQSSSPQILSQLRSSLRDVAQRGEGVEKLHAAQLANAINTDLDMASQAQTGGALGTALARANQLYKARTELGDNPLVGRILNGKVEDIPDTVFKAGRTQDVLTAKAALGDGGFNVIKRAFFNDVLNAKDTGKLLAKYADNNSDFLTTVFSPSELNTLQRIDQLKKLAATADAAKKVATIGVGGAAAGAVGGGIASRLFHTFAGR